MQRDYLKKILFRKEYYVSLWAFICPFVGYAVLGSFVHKFFIQSPALKAVILVSALTAIVFYVFVGFR
jgi:tellurite resistance protein TehA-like permease